MTEGGEVFVSPIDVVFSGSKAVQPDVVYVSNVRKSIVEEDCIRGAPDLLVPDNRPTDTDRKLDCGGLGRDASHQVFTCRSGSRTYGCGSYLPSCAIRWQASSKHQFQPLRALVADGLTSP